MRVGILTVSDRSFRGEREDLGGPALTQAMREGWWATAPEGQRDVEVSETAIVPDERDLIAAKLIEWSDLAQLDLILTTGGTGFAPRDVTPEATLDVVDRHAPGLAEVIRAEGLRVTPHAMLSRGAAGIRQRTLIVNLPGSPRGAVESLGVILPVLPHAVELLHGDASAEQHHR
jgi:molybdenum cofactor synthesis domain-containing protein